MKYILSSASSALLSSAAYVATLIIEMLVYNRCLHPFPLPLAPFLLRFCVEDDWEDGHGKTWDELSPGNPAHRRFIV